MKRKANGLDAFFREATTKEGGEGIVEDRRATWKHEIEME